MGRYNDARETLLKAVISLIGPEPQELRLVSAMNRVETIDPGDLPDGLRDEFSEFLGKMTSQKPTGNLSRVEATIKSLTQLRVNTAAQEILRFHNEVWTHVPPDDPDDDCGET